MNDNNGTHGVPMDFSGKSFTESKPDDYNGAEILDLVRKFVCKFIYLSVEQAVIVACWVAHTYAISVLAVTPYLNVTSAAKRSGKTRLLEVLQLLVANPWLTGRVTAACLIRKIDKVRPCLLLDESDAAFRSGEEYSEALRGVLNNGFYEDGVASCCVGGGHEFRDFKVFGAKAIAGIGNALPDTVKDRSIPILLQRKKRSENVTRFRKRKAKAEASEIKERLAGWITSILSDLRDAEPSLPDELTDRQQDGIEPLLAIADKAGGEWPKALRQAVIEVFGSQVAEDQSIGVQLLADIKSIFDADGDKIASADLVAKLKDIETSPWGDWGHGKGLSQNGLARLLKPFGIRPHGTIRMDDKTAKGYVRESFQDAFERYLTPEAPRSDFSSVTPSQPASMQAESEFSKTSQKPCVTDKKNASDPHKYCIVTDVTVAKSFSEDKKEGPEEGAGDGPEEPKLNSTSGDKTNGRASDDLTLRPTLVPRDQPTDKAYGKSLPSCPKCRSFALYRENDGTLTCGTCAG